MQISKNLTFWHIKAIKKGYKERISYHKDRKKLLLKNTFYYQLTIYKKVIHQKLHLFINDLLKNNNIIYN